MSFNHSLGLIQDIARQATENPVQPAPAEASVQPATPPAVSAGAPSPFQEPNMDATRRFNEAVQRKTAAGMSRSDAIRAICREDPQLHQQYLIEHNRAHGRPVAARNLAAR
jgi:hypothetical protein